MPKPINFLSITTKLKEFYLHHHRLPSFSEFQKLYGYRSKGGVSRLMGHLVKKGIVKRDKIGKLVPTPFLQGGIKVLGEVQAGFPSPAEEELVDIISLDQFLIRKPDASYLVKVTGDSMIDAGIHPGDLVIVERGCDPHSGDVVIAQVDGEWTLKYYYKRGKNVVLKAANAKYQPIQPKNELVIGGVVKACVRKYG